MNQYSPVLAFIQNLGMPELIVIGIVALLVFGKRLPEVGRSAGRFIVEFKKGLRETTDEINQIGSDSNRPNSGTTSTSAPANNTTEQK